MEENKRLDVEEIQDLEKRVDVLEGEPETPLVCPLYKTDLDELNDRITILEGDTPTDTPLTVAVLNGFEGRVEELEGGGSTDVTYSNGDKVKLNPSFFTTTLFNSLTKAATDEELAESVECSDANPIFVFLGPDTTITINGGDYSITDVNAFGVSVNTNQGKLMLLDSVQDGKFSNASTLGEIESFDYGAAKTIGKLLEHTFVATENPIVLQLSTDVTLYNPAKVMILGADSGEFNPGHHEEIDLTEKAQPLVKVS